MEKIIVTLWITFGLYIMSCLPLWQIYGVEFVKPKKMSVLIGANGGNTLKNLNQLKSACDAIGCTLILHRRTCQQSSDKHIAGNELIAQVGVNGARFDIATAIDNYPLVDAQHPSPRFNSLFLL